MACDRPVRAFIGVGSNIDPERHIPAALDMLARTVRVTGSSTFYRTAPEGGWDQPPFVNGVWVVETEMPARELKFGVLRPIESGLGRVRTADACAPRTIDLDILLFGDAVIEEPGLRVPDPDVRTRPFLAVPLLELDPLVVLPDTGERLASLVSGSSGLLAVADLTDVLREKVVK